MARSSRSGRGRFRDTRAPVAPRSRPVDPGRSTFKVATANRQAAVELGTVLHQKKRVTGAVVQSQPARRTGSTLPAKRPERQQRDATINIADERRCKGRPNSRKRSGGTGRQFVPWCKK